MKKSVMLLIMGLLCLGASAIPADPTPTKVTQPDGSSVTVVLHGDEFFHFTTTLDGYTVVKNAAGFYTYARLEGEHLVASDCIAHDVAQRSAADLAVLAGIPKRLTSRSMSQSATQMVSRRNSAMRRVGADGDLGYDNFRGLIILINYTDKKFSMNNAGDFYDDMVNTHNFTGYTLNGRRVNMTGSVRDYFYDNSAHIFDPVFDVVGPVEVNYPCTAPNGTSSSDGVFNAALNAADALVDFSDYDSDGDGYVDMVFFLVAGFSANYGGNNESYLWPHMYYLYYSPFRDGVGFGLYACSTEIAGWENSYYYDVNGIGTFCHEFGHVLGLPDLYDTDYSGSGGESRNPGDWSIMAGGSGNNYGRNPVGYSLYERYALGFTKPEVIKQSGQYELQALDESNHGLRLNTPNAAEYFLIENRQAGKWDRYLPGHGMLVARVDSVNPRVWWMNEVNCNPHHMYYELLRASYRGEDSDSDPFPGTAGVTSLTNFTDPGLLTWDGQFNEYAIRNITEHNKVISFKVEADTSMQTITETFESMPATTNENAKGVNGLYSKWDFVKCAIQNYTDKDGVEGQGVAMKKPSQVTTSVPLTIKPYMINFTVYNPTSQNANIKMSYSFDKGENWHASSQGTISVEPNQTTTVSVNLPTDAPIMIRFNQTNGHTKQCCYLDDIKLYYSEEWEIEEVIGDVNGDGEVSITDINTTIEIILGGITNGTMIERADVNGDGEVSITDINKLINIILGAN